MNKIIINIFILLWVAVGAMAQTATVTGTVTDDMGPVIGATVTVQGTSIGATTDLDGKFTLTGRVQCSQGRVDSSLCRYGRSKRTVERTYLEH